MANEVTNLLRLLQRINEQQARDAMTKVRLDGPAPDMSAWVEETAEACKPLLLALWQRGMVQAAARVAARRGKMPRVQVPNVGDGIRDATSIAGLRRHEPGNEAIFGERVQRGEADADAFGSKDLQTSRTMQLWKMDKSSAAVRMLNDVHERRFHAAEGLGFNETRQKRRLYLSPRKRLVCKAAGDVEFAFDLFNPRVLDAVDQAAYAFCRETLDTATTDLAEALEQLRQLMREGLSKGDAVELLARKVRRIFADPKRAFTIATTEGSRAQHGGQMMAAKEAGIERHSWLASADACERCLELDGKTVKIGEPFVVLQKGAPAYRQVLHPPLHPHCFCDVVEEID